MAKKVVKKLKLQIAGGKANPAPPVGPALGQAGINIGDFVKKFNDATKDKMGDIVPVEISVYDDRSYDFVLKTPPAEIESTEVLEHYGIDSIAIIQLNHKLEGIFGEISKTLFFEYQTLAALCNYFISDHPQICVQWSATQERHKETLCESDTILNDKTSKKAVTRSFVRQGSSEAIRDESIAIIGISGRYPQAEKERFVR